MTDLMKFKDGVDNEDITMKFGSTRIGRYMKDPYNGSIVDLLKNRNSALNEERHKTNPNVINFEKTMEQFVSELPENQKRKFDYFLEVPFPNPDVRLFHGLYMKFGATEGVKRRWFRSDIYFPSFGVSIELDSEEYHSDLDVALDNAKENLINEYYGIPTVLRINLASTKEWENKRRSKELIKVLKGLKELERPVILYNTIVDSWNYKNQDLLKFFPYIETCENNYFAKHEVLVKNRDVALIYNSLPEDLKITLDTRPNIGDDLKKLYKRVKNVNLAIIKP